MLRVRCSVSSAGLKTRPTASAIRSSTDSPSPTWFRSDRAASLRQNGLARCAMSSGSSRPGRCGQQTRPVHLRRRSDPLDEPGEFRADRTEFARASGWDRDGFRHRGIGVSRRGTQLIHRDERVPDPNPQHDHDRCKHGQPDADQHRDQHSQRPIGSTDGAAVTISRKRSPSSSPGNSTSKPIESPGSADSSSDLCVSTCPQRR